MKLLDIGAVAAQSGVTPSALRYYEEIGLIASVARNGLRRQFSADVIIQLQLIAMGRTAGFSLEEIAGMFGRDGRPDLSRPLLHQKADEIDRRIQELTALRDTLRHVADCPAPSHMECPTFRRLMDAASKHRRKTQNAKKPPRSPGL